MSRILSGLFLTAVAALTLVGSAGTQSPAPGPMPLPAPKVGGETSPDGTVEVAADLPVALHLKNCGGSDGSGLCVFTSITHSARWQNVPLLYDWRDWMKKYPGGGWPEKVSQMITRIAKEKGVPEPAYIQIEGSDIEPLKLACKSGRMPGVTYAYSPTGRYGGHTIAHMVSLVYLDDRWGCILDNNYPENYEWMPTATFRKTYTGNGGGWGFILLASQPPAPPHN